jgi:phage N-6-adenine-methyltransferase
MHAPAKPKIGNIAPINQAYGELCEDLHFTGYAFERGCHRLRKLLSDDSWKQCGRGFTDVDDFLNSLQLDQFAKITEERREIAKLIKTLRPEVSNRAIGRALKVPETTLRRIGAAKPEKPKQINEGLRQGGAVAKLGLRKVRGTQGTEDNEWYTPANIVAAVREVLGTIDLDPASSKIAQRTVNAAHYYTEADNGLEQQWQGIVFLNPPYAQPYIEHFADKMIAEYLAGNVTAAIMLTHNYTDTVWFQKLMDVAAAICFTKRRIRFVDPDGELASPTQGQALFFFGPDQALFKQVFRPFGGIVKKD